MNISFCISDSLREAPLAMKMTDILRKELVALGHDVDSQPADLIHIFGCWDSKLTAKAQNLQRKHIPYIFSPMGEMQPWSIDEHTIQSNLRMEQYRIVARNAMAIHACSPIERDNLKPLKLGNEAIVVCNPIVTISISAQEMCAKMEQIYEEALTTHDEKTRLEISQTTEKALSNYTEETLPLRQRICIKDILQQTLYCRYLYNRQHLDLATMHQLTQKMKNADYNEDLMADILDTMHLTHFFASLETILQQRTSLTEGFMPIPNKDDRTAKKIARSIIGE